MEFQPTRAATVFFVAVHAPILLAISKISTWPIVAVAGFAADAAATWCLFLLGAKLARRPHTTKSLIFSVLLTWSLNFSSSALADRYVPNGDVWFNAIMIALPLVFVFLVGWRLAPRTAVTARG
jgi:hypothetical protein